MADPFIGQELGGYRIARLLKRTGMSMIYLAWDAKLQREVVVKIMLPTHGGDESFATRFQQEALATARLAHPNIIVIFDFGQREDLSYMVMEYLPGGSLHDRLAAAAREGKRLDPVQSAAIVRQIALALEHAHRAGITHRDVKPSNILFARDGRPVLTDLGIARAHEGPRLTKTLTAVGTPEYMSPEQGRGEPVDGRSDIYSLGVVLYELLAGVLPFQADTVWGLIFKHIQEPPPPIETKNPAVPLAMRSVVEKALAKRPEDRFQTAHELADAIQRAVEAPAHRLYATPPGARTTPAPRATSSRRTPPRPIANDVADAKTRLLSEEAAPAPVSRQPAGQERRGLPVWLWGIGATLLLTVAAVWVLSGALRPAGRDPAAPAAQVATTTPTPTRPPVEPTATLRMVATAGGSLATRTLPPPTATATAVPPTATATRVPPTATRTLPTATRVPPTSTPIPPTRTPTRLPATATPRLPSPTQTSVSATGGVALLEPLDGERIIGKATFKWQDDPDFTLGPDQLYELIVWGLAEDPLKDGRSPVGGSTYTRVEANLSGVEAALGLSPGQGYYWGVRLIRSDGAPIRMLSGGRQFVYERTAGGGPAPAPTTPGCVGPLCP